MSAVTLEEGVLTHRDLHVIECIAQDVEFADALGARRLVVVTGRYGFGEFAEFADRLAQPARQREARRELLAETYANLFATIEEMGDVTSVVSPPLSMGVFAYPHREGARLTLETLLGFLDGEEDPGINLFTIVVKEKNFISNMRTVYREINDLLPGIDTTNQ